MAIDLFLLHCICCYFVINAVHNVFNKEGMLLHDLQVRLLKTLPQWALKPLTYCRPCMASIWGSLYFLTLTPADVVYLPLFVLITSGIAVFVNSITYS